uniref:Protochlorophyllide reductase n=1 Tax=Alexandrium monilatum TaxID=311494 RepID=A0A7S4QUW3_9DINO
MKDMCEASVFAWLGKAPLSTAGLALGSCCCLAAGVRHVRRVAAARRRLQELLAAVVGEDARIVITGATSGIGEELARQLGRHPSVSLLLGCRDTRRGERLFRRPAGVGKQPVRVVPLELLDLDSVQSFVDEVHDFLAQGGPGLRLLINNAGVMRPSGRGGDPAAAAASADATWRTNFLGPFLLTELLARRRATARASPPLSVVHVSSRLERRSKLDDPLLEEIGKGRPGQHAYSDSKKALMLWTSVRAQSLAFKGGEFCHAATPGMVDTQLGRYSLNPWLWPLTKPIRLLLLRSAAEGALSVAAAGLRKQATGCFGRYMDGEKELEDLVMQRMGEKPLAVKVVKWATQATALEARAAGYDR